MWGMDFVLFIGYVTFLRRIYVSLLVNDKFHWELVELRYILLIKLHGNRECC